MAHKMFGEIPHFTEGSAVIRNNVDEWFYFCWRSFRSDYLFIYFVRTLCEVLNEYNYIHSMIKDASEQNPINSSSMHLHLLAVVTTPGRLNILKRISLSVVVDILAT